MVRIASLIVVVFVAGCLSVQPARLVGLSAGEDGQGRVTALLYLQGPGYLRVVYYDQGAHVWTLVFRPDPDQSRAGLSRAGSDGVCLQQARRAAVEVQCEVARGYLAAALLRMQVRRAARLGEI